MTSTFWNPLIDSNLVQNESSCNSFSFEMVICRFWFWLCSPFSSSPQCLGWDCRTWGWRHAEPSRSYCSPSPCLTLLPSSSSSPSPSPPCLAHLQPWSAFLQLGGCKSPTELKSSNWLKIFSFFMRKYLKKFDPLLFTLLWSSVGFSRFLLFRRVSWRLDAHFIQMRLNQEQAKLFCIAFQFFQILSF